MLLSTSAPLHQIVRIYLIPTHGLVQDHQVRLLPLNKFDAVKVAPPPNQALELYAFLEPVFIPSLIFRF